MHEQSGASLVEGDAQVPRRALQRVEVELPVLVELVELAVRRRRVPVQAVVQDFGWGCTQQASGVRHLATYLSTDVPVFS